ncbi:hypothetical protein HAX54_011826 [Datura stramonium]|uniref:Transmembrane protein n=1 Tax=Datura stramonium TaxID=4076 RepID=A0ABS8Y6L6_DATST|nr:hypothetical protein [Datura stramonium]
MVSSHIVPSSIHSFVSMIGLIVLRRTKLPRFDQMFNLVPYPVEISNVVPLNVEVECMIIVLIKLSTNWVRVQLDFGFRIDVKDEQFWWTRTWTSKYGLGGFRGGFCGLAGMNEDNGFVKSMVKVGGCIGEKCLGTRDPCGENREGMVE